MKKRIFAFIFAATILMSHVFFAVAADEEFLPSEPSEQVVLSDLSTDEQLEFLRSCGIEVPELFSELVVIYISHFEEDPNFPVIINNPMTYKLIAQVKYAVNSYYQRDMDQIEPMARIWKQM